MPSSRRPTPERDGRPPARLRRKRRELHGVVGALGLVAGLGGLVADWYAAGTAIVAMFGIWMVGATVVNLLTDPPPRG